MRNIDDVNIHLMGQSDKLPDTPLKTKMFMGKSISYAKGDNSMHFGGMKESSHSRIKPLFTNQLTENHDVSLPERRKAFAEKHITPSIPHKGTTAHITNIISNRIFAYRNPESLTAKLSSDSERAQTQVFTEVLDTIKPLYQSDAFQNKVQKYKEKNPGKTLPPLLTEHSPGKIKKAVQEFQKRDFNWFKLKHDVTNNTPPEAAEYMAIINQYRSQLFGEMIDKTKEDIAHKLFEKEDFDTLESAEKYVAENFKVSVFGSSDLCSDLDATLICNDRKLEPVFVKIFNANFKEKTGSDSATFCDTNLYTSASPESASSEAVHGKSNAAKSKKRAQQKSKFRTSEGSQLSEKQNTVASLAMALRLGGDKILPTLKEKEFDKDLLVESEDINKKSTELRNESLVFCNLQAKYKGKIKKESPHITPQQLEEQSSEAAKNEMMAFSKEEITEEAGIILKIKGARGRIEAENHLHENLKIESSDTQQQYKKIINLRKKLIAGKFTPPPKMRARYQAAVKAYKQVKSSIAPKLSQARGHLKTLNKKMEALRKKENPDSKNVQNLHKEIKDITNKINLLRKRRNDAKVNIPAVKKLNTILDGLHNKIEKQRMLAMVFAQEAHTSDALTVVLNSQKGSGKFESIGRYCRASMELLGFMIDHSKHAGPALKGAIESSKYANRILNAIASLKTVLSSLKNKSELSPLPKELHSPRLKQLESAYKVLLKARKNKRNGTIQRQAQTAYADANLEKGTEELAKYVGTIFTWFNKNMEKLNPHT